MKVPLSDIRERAKLRPAGYYEDVISRGQVVEDWLEIDDAQLGDLTKKYRGIGDVVATVAKPIAKLLGLDCGGGCDERQDTLNKLLPL